MTGQFFSLHTVFWTLLITRTERKESVIYRGKATGIR